MAKLKAPLMSLGASGRIANTLVFFPWKGLNVVREYVIPSNPKSTGQTTQRGYITAAVADIHAAQIASPGPLGSLDKAAYSLLGSLYATPRTWFNQICKQWCNQSKAAKVPTTFRGASLAIASGQITITVYSDEIAVAKITAGNFYYGTSKTAMLTAIAATIDTAAHTAIKAIPGLANGTRYYFQFKTTTEATYVGDNSGIYHETPHA